MSYILEALKKAQAERQLGTPPTIHALPMQAEAHPVSGLRQQAPMLLGLSAVGIALACAAALFWRQPAAVTAPLADAPAPLAASPVPAPVTAPGVTAPSAATPASALLAPPVAIAAALPPVSAPPAPKQVAAEPARAVPAARSVATAPEAARTPAPSVARAPAAAPEALKAASEPAPRSTSADAQKTAAGPEDTQLTLRELPEQIQREIPSIEVGGYIYSKNPADRLLLINKVLRHEGEEVAPGLTLEKLLPRAAVLSFRGYRYRIAY